jgi:molybdate transport system regulatory protein
MATPAVHFRVQFGRNEAVGPGKIALLEHIVASGSLSQAARELRMSYRRAWQLLESVNGCFREAVVVTSRGGRGGGGATLTALGRQLIRVYRSFDRETQARAARAFKLLASKVRPRLPRAVTRGGRRGAAVAPIRRLSARA